MYKWEKEVDFSLWKRVESYQQCLLFPSVSQRVGDNFQIIAESLQPIQHLEQIKKIRMSKKENYMCYYKWVQGKAKQSKLKKLFRSSETF